MLCSHPHGIIMWPCYHSILHFPTCVILAFLMNILLSPKEQKDIRSKEHCFPHGVFCTFLLGFFFFPSLFLLFLPYYLSSFLPPILILLLWTFSFCPSLQFLTDAISFEIYLSLSCQNYSSKNKLVVITIHLGYY
jgi:hypothetical protein